MYQSPGHESLEVLMRTSGEVFFLRLTLSPTIRGWEIKGERIKCKHLSLSLKPLHIQAPLCISALTSHSSSLGSLDSSQAKLLSRPLICLLFPTPVPLVFLFKKHVPLMEKRCCQNFFHLSRTKWNACSFLKCSWILPAGINFSSPVLS